MIIIDTSVAFKWFEDEKNSTDARKILKNHLQGKEEISVPDLFFYELTNAWCTKSVLLPKDIKNNLDRLEKFALNIIPMSFTSLNKAMEFSKQYHVSVYDALYAVLAEEKKCRLVTADTKFISKADQDYIISLANSDKN